MKFTTITPDEFRQFAAKSPYQIFTQTPEIAQYREKMVGRSTISA